MWLNWSQLPLGLSYWDIFAFLWTVILWAGMTWWIERGPYAGQSMTAIMRRHRMRWMKVTQTRSLRIVDITILTNLQNGAAFFASTALLAIGGVVTMIAKADTLTSIANDLPISVPASREAWEIKLFFLLWICAYSFLKFAWSHRLFGYNVILLGAIPHPEIGGQALTTTEKTESDIMCEQAGKMNIYAARSFNRGLRGIYFALGALGWLVGPIMLIIGVTMVALMINRREYHSDSRASVDEHILIAQQETALQDEPHLPKNKNR